MQPGAGLFLYPVERVIAPVRVVMEQHQVAYFGRVSHLQDLANDGVTPTALHRHVTIEVLRIMDQDVRSCAEGDQLLHPDHRLAWGIELVVGDIHDGGPVPHDPEAGAPSGMIHGDSGHLESVFRQEEQLISRDTAPIGR